MRVTVYRPYKWTSGCTEHARWRQVISTDLKEGCLLCGEVVLPGILVSNQSFRRYTLPYCMNFFAETRRLHRLIAPFDLIPIPEFWRQVWYTMGFQSCSLTPLLNKLWIQTYINSAIDGHHSPQSTPSRSAKGKDIPSSLATLRVPLKRQLLFTSSFLQSP